ncbi:MAG: hypothetical protein WAP51_03000 [Candidatus Sungiibacteriota bacterium]
MSDSIKSEVQQLKNLLLQPTPIWIDGIDFDAFNFGDKNQDYSEAGRDSVISSASGSAIIDRSTGKWRFVGPHMPIRNVSHVQKFDKAKVSLTFDDVKREVENGG